eukprot:scaffold16934_cov91-Isochrysis_galbana.AAC.3
MRGFVAQGGTPSALTCWGWCGEYSSCSAAVVACGARLHGAPTGRGGAAGLSESCRSAPRDVYSANRPLPAGRGSTARRVGGSGMSERQSVVAPLPAWLSRHSSTAPDACAQRRCPGCDDSQCRHRAADGFPAVPAG